MLISTVYTEVHSNDSKPAPAKPSPHNPANLSDFAVCIPSKIKHFQTTLRALGASHSKRSILQHRYELRGGYTPNGSYG
jgi:hypothetical protein